MALLLQTSACFSATAATCRVEPAGFSRYDLFDPVVRCPSGALQRMGSAEDGGKMLCGLDRLKARKACVVFSIGSNGQYDFEQAFLKVCGTAPALWVGAGGREAKKLGAAAASRKRPQQELNARPGLCPLKVSPKARACWRCCESPPAWWHAAGPGCTGSVRVRPQWILPALQETKCEVHTFDCHYRGGVSQHKGRHFFHPVW